jgi:hypothetical protein
VTGEGHLPLGLRKLPRSMVRWMFAAASGRVKAVPDMLGLPPSAWWSGAAFDVLRATNAAPLPGLSNARSTVSGSGRGLVFTAFADGWLTEEAPHSSSRPSAGVMTHPQGPASKLRKARRTARVRVRTASQQPAQRSPMRNGR